MSGVEHSKHRCPACDCLNNTASVVPSILDSGCEYCNDPYLGSLCAYKALFECSYYASISGYGSSVMERITAPCMILRKDCPQGCTYSSRKRNGSFVVRGSNCTLSLLGDSVVKSTPCPGDVQCALPRCFIVEVDVQDDRGLQTSRRLLKSESGLQWDSVSPGELNPNTKGCIPDIVDGTGQPVGSNGLVCLQFGDYKYGFGFTATLNVTCDSGSPGNVLALLNIDVADTLKGGARVGGTLYEWSLCYGAAFNLGPPAVDCGASETTAGPACYPIPTTWCDSHGFQCQSCHARSLTCEDLSASGMTFTPASDGQDLVPPFTAACVGGGNCLGSTGRRLREIRVIPVLCSDYEIPTDDILGWTGGCTWLTDPASANTHRLWTLSITGATAATLSLLSLGGFTAVYATTNWQCYDRSEFVLQSHDPEVTGLPRRLCVAPVNAPVVSGDCSASFCDEGAPVRNFSVGPITCQGSTLIANGEYTFGRGVPIPEEVETVLGSAYEEQRCNYFWREFAYTSSCTYGDPWSGEIGILIHVVDPDEVYCSDSLPGPNDDRYLLVTIFCKNASGTYVQSGQYCDGYECCNTSIGVITFDVECCCVAIPPVPCGTGSDTIPGVLVATDGTNNVTLTYNSGTGQWEGTGVLFGCASGAVTMAFILPESSCDLFMTIANNTTTSSSTATPALSPFSVDFLFLDSCRSPGATDTITVTEP